MVDISANAACCCHQHRSGGSGLSEALWVLNWTAADDSLRWLQHDSTKMRSPMCYRSCLLSRSSNGDGDVVKCGEVDLGIALPRTDPLRGSSRRHCDLTPKHLLELVQESYIAIAAHRHHAARPTSRSALYPIIATPPPTATAPSSLRRPRPRLPPLRPSQRDHRRTSHSLSSSRSTLADLIWPHSAASTSPSPPFPPRSRSSSSPSRAPTSSPTSRA